MTMRKVGYAGASASFLNNLLPAPVTSKVFRRRVVKYSFLILPITD